MKKVLFLSLIAATLFYCKEIAETKIDGYRVIGEATGIHNGIRAYLKTEDKNGRTIVKDTAIIMNENFKFEGKLDSTEMVNLTINSVQGSFQFVLENEEIELKINSEKISDSEVTGSASNDALAKYNKFMTEQERENIKLRSQFREALPQKRKELREKIIGLNERNQEYPFEFLSENQNNFFSLILIKNLLKQRKKDVGRIAESFYLLPNELRYSDFGKNLHNQIERLKQERAALTAIEIGRRAPNFSAPNPRGKELSLNEIKGKATIIDFWAAWCGPCRRENPNVVRVYDKYHKNGLEIIGVSLDGNPRQKDPKAAWTKAIKNDNLNWHHVSNLQYFNEPIAKTYNIRSIPATFILDENGVIVAKNLRGKALENKISELLD